ncbi:CD109 antigen-like [Contarinia nasturtii]|uniref:CD109 antigen-like n=1 Tax=Contarinia nasturtii TaxID=265458 RepID=UPI0012D387E0|nr:CD109 antigen-like [Contarinia nasturtii]
MRCFALLVIFIVFVDFVTPDLPQSRYNVYTIVAPQNIRSHTDYKVSITLHDYIEPVTVRVAIEDGIKYKNEANITISSSKTELVTLRIDNLENRGYRFVAEGLSGMNFTEMENLKIESKEVSLFIQTDKAIYKPGDSIKFRVLILDYKLRPVKLTPDSLLNVNIADPEKNRIQQWLKVTPTKGVFTSELQLSDHPILGNWKFEAQVGNEIKTKEIEVAEYVLPKFEVTIDSPADVSAKNGKIRVIIRSKYTFGKLVKGEAVVSLTPKNHFRRRIDNTEGVLKTINVDGKGTVEFDIDNELRTRFSEGETREYELKAIVIEELTGRNQSATKTITIHQSRYKITPTGLSHKFIPGLPFTFSIEVTHHDNSPVLLTEKTKLLTIEQKNENRTCYDFVLGPKGTVDITLQTNNDSFDLKVKYIDEEYDLGYFHPYSSGVELKVNILTERPKLNENVLVEVQSNYLLPNFTYLIIGHFGAVYAENVNVDSKSHTFKFNATFDLVPKATVIVYHLKDNEMVSSKTDVAIDSNYVKLKLSTAETQPGKDVNIDVTTNPESRVGLVGVDQSVLLLKKGDGLSRDDIMQEMDEHQKHFFNAGTGPWSVAWRNHYEDFFNAFDDCKMILITNAKQRRFELWLSSDRFYDRILHGSDLVDVRFGEYSPMPLSSSQASSSIFQHSGVAYSEMSPKTEISAPIEPPRVRNIFPETFLWEDFDVNNANGSLTLTKKVPDTITSWIISAFSINPSVGLGLTMNPKSLKVLQPFFVSLNLPYSVKRNEVVAIPAVLFNYLETDLTAELTLHNENGDFEFVDDIEGDKTLRKRQVAVASNAGVSSTFLVRFTSVGKITLKITATSAVAGDAIERVLQVDPEGVPQYINKVLFVDLRETNSFDAIQNVEVPENIVPGSLKISVNAIGDLLGGTIQNLHKLIRLPTGCGEQNMLNFVPNIVVLDYLTAVGELDASIKSRAIKFLLSGYQRELTYRRNDGSFSIFGKRDSIGSTWLTAFVAKSFIQAGAYIDVDNKIIDEALDFLSTLQASDGSFPEVGKVYDKVMQGGSSKGVALTAYAAIAFLKNKKQTNWKHEETVNKAIMNIASNVKDIDNPYALAIAAYALQLADHSNKDEILNALVNKTLVDGQYKWWTAKKPGSKDTQSISIDVEITSYGILSLIEANRLTEAFAYFKWLLAQRNDKGGFFGTQDTVIGLEALATYSRLFNSKENNVQLKIQAETINEKVLNISSENAMLLQTVDLPSDTRSLHLVASGKGYSLFQLSYRYNLNESDVYSIFTLKPTVLETTSGHLNVKVCSRFNPRTSDDEHSNMVIMEVAMPSGFLIEKDRLEELLQKPHIKLVETKRGETVADIYIDQMIANEEICLEIQGYRLHKVAENKPVPVRIYDYYDSSRSAREFYEIPFITSCDICEGDECSKSCKK